MGTEEVGTCPIWIILLALCTFACESFRQVFDDVENIHHETIVTSWVFFHDSWPQVDYPDVHPKWKTDSCVLRSGTLCIVISTYLHYSCSDWNDDYWSLLHHGLSSCSSRLAGNEHRQIELQCTNESCGGISTGESGASAARHVSSMGQTTCAISTIVFSDVVSA